MRLARAGLSVVLLGAVALAGGLVWQRQQHGTEGAAEHGAAEHGAAEHGAAEHGAAESRGAASGETAAGPAATEPSATATDPGRSAAASKATAACHRGMLGLLAEARAPVSVEFFSSPSPALAAARQQVVALLDALAKPSAGRFSWKETRVHGAQTEARVRGLGLEPVSLPPSGAAGAGSATPQGFLGAELRVGNERGVLPFQVTHDDGAFDFFFAQKLRELLAKAERRVTPVGLASGLEELRLDEPRLLVGPNSPSLEGLLENSFPFYELRAQSLDGSLDELARLPSLWVTQPGRKLSDEELRRLDDFLMLGGKTLVVIASAVNVKPGDDHFHGALERHGLERLLSPYGVELERDLVRDPGASLELPALAGTEGLRVLHVPVVSSAGAEASLDAGFAGFFQLERLAFPYASTLTLHPERQPGAGMKALARTRAKALSSEATLHLDPLHGAHEEGGEARERVLAALVEGELHSAFASGSAPGRLLVIASSHFGANPFARALPPRETNLPVDGALVATPLGRLADAYARRHLTATILAFKNLLDWATGEDELLACSALIRSAPE